MATGTQTAMRPAFPPPVPPPPANTVTGPRGGPPPPPPPKLADTAIQFGPPAFPPTQTGQRQEKKPANTGLYIVAGLLLLALAAAYPVYRYIYPAPIKEIKQDKAKKEEILIPPAQNKPGAAVVSLFTAEPERVAGGGTATLRWWVTDASEVVINQDIGKVASKGSIEVKPRKETEYILTATGAGGEATAKVTIGVGAVTPPGQPEKEPAKVSSTGGAIGGATGGKPPATQPATQPAETPHADPARAQQLYEEGMAKHRGQPGSAAIPSFEQAAALGEPRAMLELGKIYAAGDGVGKDAEKAAGWYRKAADLGNASAMVFLGALYAQGAGVPKDLAEAAKWLRKAADAGNAVAMDGLGQMYANGQGLPVDAAQAVIWYRKAIENNNAPAMYHLGLLLENGAGPVAKNATEAMQLFQRAANAGYAPAKAKLSSGAGPVTLTGIRPDPIVANKSQMYRLTGAGLSANTTVRSDVGAVIGSRDGQSDFRPVAVAPDGSWIAVYISLPPPQGRTIRLTAKNPGGSEASLDVPVQK
jgi:TPR repeat protein